MTSAYVPPPGGSLTAAHARMSAGLAGPGGAARRGRRRGVRYYAPSPMYRAALGYVFATRVGPQLAGPVRHRRMRWLGQDDGSDDGSVPNIPYTSAPLPAELTPPETEAGGAYVSPAGIEYPSVATTEASETDQLTAPSTSTPYTTGSLISQLTNIATGTQPQRVMLTPTPTNPISAALANLPSWALPAALVVGAIALIGGTTKRRR